MRAHPDFYTNPLTVMVGAVVLCGVMDGIILPGMQSTVVSFLVLRNSVVKEIYEIV
jgi:glutamine amidotransferase PdxT